ncbi:phosphatase PAP2 family protein [Qipengyuania oceanensis]|uniref:Phosphatase PAP2 family protein n=1 Tax=Qipengyuania oceanensis TaxID=1463597 RepID=A0A844YAA7_9SPHN|nr:phosphatase PAP2 family protein [Qipengyuania oceanensis]MXO61846.1 phosphatase PAP2 family protein [Qipengyuania oceanensis]
MLQKLRTAITCEYRLLLGAIGTLLLLWGFGALAGEMIEGETGAYDSKIELALRHSDNLAVPVGPAFLKTAMIDLTALGSETILTLVTVLAIAFLLLRKRQNQALLVAAAVGGGALLSGLLKSQFSRARPEIVPHLVPVHSASFPSGHAMNSAIVYLTIAVLIARSYEDARTRNFIVGLAVIATGVIGFSRVYLGVHWPSDVAAGWLVGGAWASLMGLVAVTLQRRRKIEQPARPSSDTEQARP